MQLCDDGHDEVCYESRECPACVMAAEKYQEGYDEGYDKGYEEGQDTVSED